MSLALDLATLAALRAEVARRETAIKQQFKAMHGRGTQYASLGDLEVGVVTVAKPSISWTVSDPHALLRWVRANHPSEVVESVAPAFVTRLLADCKAAGDAVTRDGEIVPGVTDVQREGSVRVTVTPEQAELIVAAWRAGVLSVPDVHELEKP